MTPYYSKDGIVLYCGDCVAVMQTMPDNSIDAIVTDPPYGLGFMGKGWDHSVPGVEVWIECLRILKPGGHLLAFAGTRTQHRMAVRIEDAGFEIRDMIAWCYGSGFPKSLDVSKAIDKAAGAEREILLEKPAYGIGGNGCYGGHAEGATATITAPATEAAKQWAGWGTALKPALEPITVARKPLCGTVAENVLQHGTGGLNVDGCRVGTTAADAAAMGRCNTPGSGRFGSGTKGHIYGGGNGASPPNTKLDTTQGRWPANLIHDGSDEVLALFPESVSCNSPSSAKPESKFRPGQGNYQPQGTIYPGDSGSAARFFYTPKADSAERRQSKHPTVKPLDLMRYLVRLVCPAGGIVLDPFMGSGSTIEAARAEHCKSIGIELSEEYCGDAVERLRQGVFNFAEADA